MTDVSTDVNVGGGVQIPGGAIASAAYEFYKNPSAEGAANAAMRTVCGVATAGAGAASGVCSYFTVANFLSASDWFVAHLPSDWQAKGVKECWLYYPDIERATYLSFVALTTALNTSWYATRAAMGLPFKANADAVAEYSPATTAVLMSDGLWHGTTSPAKLIGYQSKRLGGLVKADPLFTSNPSIVVGAGWFARTIRLTGAFTVASDGSSPLTDCSGLIPAWNAAAGGLFAKYRLEPAKKAAKQVLKEWGAQFDAEYKEIKALQQKTAAAKASQQKAAAQWASSVDERKKAKTAVILLAIVGLAIGGGAAYAARKKTR